MREQSQLGRLAALQGGDFDPVAGHDLDAQQTAAAHDVALDTGVERRHAGAVRTRGRQGATMAVGSLMPHPWLDHL